MSNKIISLEERMLKNLIDKGNNLIFEGDFTEATKIFKEAYKKDPNNVSVIYNLAALSIEEGFTEESEKLLLEAFEKDSNHVYTLIGLANIIYYKTENFNMASYYIEPALKHNPESIELLTAYANLCMLEGKLKEAIEYFQKAILLDRDYTPALTGISTVYNFAGLHHLSKHRFEQAIFSFKQSIDFNPDWIAPRLNLVRSFGFLKKFKTAMDMLNEITDLFGSDVDLDYLIKINETIDNKQILLVPLMLKMTEAKLLQQIGETEQAKEIFLKIYKLNQEFPTLNFSLALIEVNEKNYIKAEEYIKNELIVSPSSIKVKALRYVIYKKMNKTSSWDIHFNILKKTTDDVYKLFAVGILFFKYELNTEGKEMLDYTKRLNNTIYEELTKHDFESTLNAIYSNYSDLSLV